MCLLALLLCCRVPLRTLAAQPTVTQPGEIKKGDTVTFEVKLSETVRTKSGGVRLQYDTRKIRVTDYQWKLTDPMLQSFDTKTGIGVFAYQEAVELSGVIFAATLQIREDAPYGEANFPVEVKFKNSDAPQDDRTFENILCQIYVSCMDHRMGDHPGKCAVCGKTISSGSASAPTQPAPPQNDETSAPGASGKPTPEQSGPSTDVKPTEPAGENNHNAANIPETSAPGTANEAEKPGINAIPEETGKPELPAQTDPEELQKPDAPQDPEETQEPVLTIGASAPQEPDSPGLKILLIAGGVLVVLAGGVLLGYLRGNRGGKFAKKKNRR